MSGVDAVLELDRIPPIHTIPGLTERPSSLRAEDRATSNERTLVCDAITRLVPKAKSILDVGIGDGKLSRFLIENYRPDRYTAIEPVAQNADNIRQGLNDESIRQVIAESDVQATTWEEAELGEKKYDLIVMSHSTYFFDPGEAPELLMKGINALSEGGSMVLVVNSDDAPIQRLYDFLAARGVRTPHSTPRFGDAVSKLDGAYKDVVPATITPIVQTKERGPLNEFMWNFLSPTFEGTEEELNSIKEDFGRLVDEITQGSNIFPFPTSVYKFEKPLQEK